MNRLKYCVTQSGYTAKVGDGVISQKLDGGASTSSLKNVSHTANVQWVVGEGGYQYLMAFYRVWRRTPSQPFIARLIIDDGVARITNVISLKVQHWLKRREDIYCNCSI